MDTTAKEVTTMDSRIVGKGVFWLATASMGAGYGRFLPDSTFYAAVMGALVALVVLYVWVVASR